MTPRTQKVTSSFNDGWNFGGNRVRIDACRMWLYVYDRCHAPASPRRPITEGKRLQFRAESFNFANTPAFGQPGTTLNGLGVGQITSAGDPRRIQFGLKLIM